tara:strand:+ start:8770 stop:8979 length:210 start_codon:yes stop_codon:yes gene_type:complete
MEISEYIKEHFLDSCSNNMHDLNHRRELINIYKEQLKKIKKFIKIEDESLKKLEDDRLNKISQKNKAIN